MLAHVDLCSGIGGFALGFQRAGLSQPVLFCDIEPWSRQVLAKHWPDVPIAEDVKELASDPRRLVPDCDILTAGYPCQPFSQAGVRRGEEDDRHIWPEIFTIIEAKLPRWIVCENVAGHISLGLDQVLSDLEDKAGYEVQTFCVGAVAVDAPHRRQRVWIVAHSSGGKWQSRAEEQSALPKVFEEPREHDHACGSGAPHATDVADAQSQRVQGHGPGGEQVAHSHESQGLSLCGDERPTTAVSQSQSSMGGVGDGLSTWLDEPRGIPRVAVGVKQRTARLKGLGNAIVPQIAMQIGLTIKAVEHG